MKFPMDSNAQNAFNIARQTAKFYSNEFTGTEHLLYGILKTDCAATKIFAANGFSPEDLAQLFRDDAERAAVSVAVPDGE